MILNSKEPEPKKYNRRHGTDTKKVTLSFPIEFHRRLKAKAKSRCESMSQVVEGAYVSKYGE